MNKVKKVKILPDNPSVESKNTIGCMTLIIEFEHLTDKDIMFVEKSFSELYKSEMKSVEHLTEQEKNDRFIPERLSHLKDVSQCLRQELLSNRIVSSSNVF